LAAQRIADTERHFARQRHTQHTRGDTPGIGTRLPLQTMNPEIGEFLGVPEAGHLVAVSLRLVAAAILGGLIGAEREWVGKAAGLRTHMLVSLGAALFIVAPTEAGLDEIARGHIISGIVAGIGFIGAGAILKRADREEIQGLTTAASIWLTAGIGVSVAVGPLWIPVLSVVCALLILFLLGLIQRRSGNDSGSRP
jgi:putative Mg2+ transporter-C (MgtC) family protein